MSKKWIEKLDIPVKVTAGSVNNYVYRLKYGQAATVGDGDHGVLQRQSRWR